MKIFPAGSLGIGYVKALRAPLSHIPLLAVGGVGPDNVREFMAAGCVGAGVGGNLTNKEGYVSVAEQLVERFGVKKVAITLRTSLSAFDNLWAGMLYDAKTKKAVFSTEYKLHIVDRVGGRDSFGGGLIYALATGKNPQAAIDFAVAASALKHSIEHDFNLVSVKEVEALVSGGGTGRIQR